MSLCGFCHYNPTYNTILESLGPWQYSESIFIPFDRHQDDQEGQECPLSGDLEDFECLDGDFVTVTPHMIPFWNHKDHGSTQKVYSYLLIIIKMIRKVKNVL